MTKTRERPDAQVRSRRVQVRRPGPLREVGRNLRRRKLRSFLTLSGIALGAFALMVMGSLAENFNTSISSLEDFLEEQILVRPKGSNVFFSAGHLPVSLAEEYEAVDGVGVVVPRVTVLVEEGGAADFGPPRQVFGVDIEQALRTPLTDLNLASGRQLRAGEEGSIVLGASLARDLGSGDDPAGPGDTVTIRGHDFEVVGVGQATATPVDDFATTSIADTRAIAKEADPFLQVEQIADEFSIYPADGADPNELAERIEPISDRALVFPPEESSQQIGQLTAIWNTIILGSALVALLVGGVAIINTMIFSVTERTREIGVKKAIGASSRDVLREFLAESVILSLLGGVLGGGAGYLFVTLINAVSREEGVIAFTITPRLTGFVFLLAVVIGAGAGFLPARRAARVDPVRALRTLG